MFLLVGSKHMSRERSSRSSSRQQPTRRRWSFPKTLRRWAPRRAFKRTPSQSPQKLGMEVLEERRLLFAAGLTQHGHETDVFEQTVYVNFDGAEDASYDGPVSSDRVSVPAFQGPDSLEADAVSVAAAVVESLNDQYSGLGLTFTASRPDASVEYSTVHVGGDGAEFRAYGDFLGVAEKVDEGNLDHNDSAFVFSDKISASPGDVTAYVESLATVIAHETGHLLGFGHPDSGQETSSPLASVGFEVTVETLDGGTQRPHLAHQWIGQQGYEFFEYEFGASDITTYVGGVSDYSVGPDADL